MKNLEFNQMESLNGGDNCSNATGVFIGASLATSAIVGAFTFGIGAVIGIGISLAAATNCHNGWAEDLIG